VTIVLGKNEDGKSFKSNDKLDLLLEHIFFLEVQDALPKISIEPKLLKV